MLNQSYLLAAILSSIILNSYVQSNDVEVDNTNVVNQIPNIITGNLNVTTYVGDTVMLPCEIEHLGHHHVNWLKIQGDIPLTLTVGYQQFSRNLRYRVARLHNNDKNKNNRIESWNFEIRKVDYDDQGLYQCYIKLNSKHKIKVNVYLIVKSESDKVLDEGRADALSLSSNQLSDDPRSEKLSSVEKVNISPNNWIKLRCNATEINQSVKSSKLNNYDLHWYKDGKLIEQDSRRLKKWVSSYENPNYMELEVFAVDPEDSGVYQCKSDNQILKNIIVNVLDNSNGSSSNAKRMLNTNLIFFISAVYLILRNISL